MPSLHFQKLLLPEGWRDDVRIEIGAAADGTITSIDAGTPPRPGDTRIEGFALPGMPNLHSHAFQFAVAGCAEQPNQAGGDGDDFWSWRELMYGVANSVTPEDVEVIATALYIACLKGGYTSLAEFHYLHGAADEDPIAMQRAIRAAADAAGIACTLLPTLYAQRGFDGGACGPEHRRFARTVERHLDDLRSLAREDVSFGLGLHSLRAVGPDALREVLAGFDDIAADAPIHIHIAEQMREVEDCLAWSGSRPVAWLLDNASVDERWCLVHATHVDADEVRGVAERGAVVGICPTTEADLGDGIVPARAYRDAGARLGVGSDQHVATDAAMELRALEWSQRLAERKRCVLAADGRSAARWSWEHAALAGAQACGRAAGRIEVGRKADVVVLDATAPRLAGLPADAVLGLWMMAPGSVRVRDVFVGGRPVVRDGRHAAEEEVGAALRETLAKLRERHPVAKR